MSNTEKLQKIFQSLSGESQAVIAVPTELIHFIGNPNKAVLLAQLIYWSDKGIRKDGLIWKSYAEIFDSTGIKQKTCNRYYNEFREMGFFHWRQKLACGKNVVHYKLDLDKLTESIKTYWLGRESQNVHTESANMSNSITENTTQITNIEKTTLSQYNMEKNSFEDNSLFEGVIDNNENEADIIDVLINAGFGEEPAVALPTDFEPSLENQFWSVTNFPKKSVILTTESFAEFFGGKPEVIKTPADWQSAWRKWMREERGQFGYCEEKLYGEQEKITAKVRNLIHKFALECGNSFLRRDDFYYLFSREEFQFSKETIDICLEELESEQEMVRLFDHYIYTADKVK